LISKRQKHYKSPDELLLQGFHYSWGAFIKIIGYFSEKARELFFISWEAFSADYACLKNRELIRVSKRIGRYKFRSASSK